jgi:hypothetical protein
MSTNRSEDRSSLCSFTFCPRPPTRQPERSEGSPYVPAVFRPARATAACARHRNLTNYI